jgi:fatty-acyl-CoA synthase
MQLENQSRLRFDSRARQNKECSPNRDLPSGLSPAVGQSIPPQNTKEVLAVEQSNSAGDVLTFSLPEINHRTVSISASEFANQVTQTVHAFHHLGLCSGDVVSIMLPGIPQALVVACAATRIGVANPIAPAVDSETLTDVLTAAQSKILITSAPMVGSKHWRTAIEAQERYRGLAAILTVNLASYLAGMRRTVAQLFRRRNHRAIHDAEVYDFDVMIRSFPEKSLPNGEQFAASDAVDFWRRTLR